MNIVPKRVKEFTLRVWTLVSQHIQNWQELYLWMPIVLFGALFFNEWVGRVDPQSGKDGLGALTGYANLGVRAVLTGFTAWIFKKNYFGELSKRHVRDLQDSMLHGGYPAIQSYKVLILDRLEWLPCLLVAYFIFSQ